MLDRQWYLLRGEMERTKEPTRLFVGHILDIDLAVVGCDMIPRDRLEAAGFTLHPVRPFKKLAKAR